MIWEIFRFALSGILANKGRSILTMLGVIIGVLSVVTLLAIGEGVRDEFSGQIEQLGTNTVYVISGDFESGSFNPTSLIGGSTVTNGDMEAVRELSHVTDVIGIVLLPTPPRTEAATSPTSIVAGSMPAVQNVFDLSILEGRFLSDDDLTNDAYVAAIGSVVRDELFTESDPVGQSLTIGENTFDVVGVVNQEKIDLSSFGGPNFSNAVFIPFTVAQSITGVKTIFRMVVNIDDPENIESVAMEMESVIQARHEGVKDFSVLTEKEALGLFDSFFGILTQAVSGIAAISLVVGGIGIMNIMLVSVSERTKEIGIRKAIGATNRSILTQFLIEAAVISLLGGIVGLLGAAISTRLITFASDIPTVISIRSILLAFGVSVLVGVVFGLTPAVKGSRKDPIDALRYE